MNPYISASGGSRAEGLVSEEAMSLVGPMSLGGPMSPRSVAGRLPGKLPTTDSDGDGDCWHELRRLVCLLVEHRVLLLCWLGTWLDG